MSRCIMLDKKKSYVLLYVDNRRDWDRVRAHLFLKISQKHTVPVRLQNIYDANEEQQPLAFPTHCWDSPHSAKRERKRNRWLICYPVPLYASYYIIHILSSFLLNQLSQKSH